MKAIHLFSYFFIICATKGNISDITTSEHFMQIMFAYRKDFSRMVTLGRENQQNSAATIENLLSKICNKKTIEDLVMKDILQIREELKQNFNFTKSKFKNIEEQMQNSNRMFGLQLAGTKLSDGLFYFLAPEVFGFEAAREECLKTPYFRLALIKSTASYEAIRNTFFVESGEHRVIDLQKNPSDPGNNNILVFGDGTLLNETDIDPAGIVTNSGANANIFVLGARNIADYIPDSKLIPICQSIPLN